MATAKFIYDHPLKNSDLYYATKFYGHDPYAYFEYNGRKYLVLDDLEIERAKREAVVDKVLLASKYKKGFELRKGQVIEIIDAIFKEYRIKTLEVPANFPLFLADALRAKNYKLKIIPPPFFQTRVRKKRPEKKAIVDAQKIAFKLVALVENILAKSKIKEDKLFFKGKILTSELLKEVVQIEALHLGHELKEGLIIACGKHSIDPHDQGNGPIKPHQSIIVDIFPCSNKTFYWGDTTRTFCRGKAPPELKRLYKTVKHAQEIAISSIRAGVNATTVHERVMKFFESCGYKSGEINNRMQGFIHSTGHGIGLDLHETPPFIGTKDCKLEEGNVTSVEPGLYYKGIGGVRIEDLVYVTKNGCEVLGNYPKKLEIL